MTATSIAVVAATLQVLAVQTSGTPADPQCVGKIENNGAIQYSLPSDIEDVHDSSCETQWTVNGTVKAVVDSDGNAECMLPITSATAKTAVMGICSDGLEYIFICPSKNVHRQLQCSCHNSGVTSSAQASFPNQRIGLFVSLASTMAMLAMIITYAVCCKNGRSPVHNDSHGAV